ncbi:Lipase (class 3), putative [Angomonas deanei]|uniref:Lipase (Class 3), putative n=1 Tax=Angomonas deanei TaxID=59799 RepID=A0A7G2CQM3_9TRYP|nr:Lipase (class 3), putative [Angomonas deanei]
MSTQGIPDPTSGDLSQMAVGDKKHSLIAVVLSSLVYDASEEKIQETKTALQAMGYDDEIILFEREERVLYCRVGDTLYFVCRGTVPTSVKDVLTNVKQFFLFDETGNFLAHDGYLQRAEEVFQQHAGIFATIVRTLKEDPNLRLVFTGHSLGGGVAQLLIAKFHQKYREYDDRTTAYVYGSPIIGGKEMLRYYNEEGISRRIQNIANEGDPIPRVFSVCAAAAVHKLSRRRPWTYWVSCVVVMYLVVLLAGATAAALPPSWPWLSTAVFWIICSTTIRAPIVAWRLIKTQSLAAQLLPLWEDAEPLGTLMILPKEDNTVPYVGRWDEEGRREQLKPVFSFSMESILTLGKTLLTPHSIAIYRERMRRVFHEAPLD